jgi:hypothetical protein
LGFFFFLVRIDLPRELLSQGLESQVIRRIDQEGKERLRGRCALCPQPLSKPFRFSTCPAPAPSPSRRFGLPDEVKERLQRSALQRMSGLIKALPLFFFVQLQGLEAQVISQTDQEGKERLRGRFALCLPPLSKPFRISTCPAPAPSPSRRFGLPDEVKERLQRAALQRLSGLIKAHPLFFSPVRRVRKGETRQQCRRGEEE